MSNVPGGSQPDKPEVEEKSSDIEEKEDVGPHLSLADLIAPHKLDLPPTTSPDAQAGRTVEPPKNFDTRDRSQELGLLSNLPPDSPSFYDQHSGISSGEFTIRAFKAEYKTEETPVLPNDQLVDKFLKDTLVPDETDDKTPEKQEIVETRQQLATANNLDDIIDKALRLAKQYEELNCIEEAKKAVNLSLGIDPDNQKARELFKDLEHAQLPDLAVAPTSASTFPFSRSSLVRAIQRLSGGNVIVLGDFLIDELLEGRPERISREAPVLVLEHVDTELQLGGAGNAAHNIVALGGTCHAIGICGSDVYSQKLGELLEQSGVSYALIEDSTRPTTVKTRILSRAHSLKHQLIRLDRISHQNISPANEQEIIKCLEKLPRQYGAIILSDYKSGVVTPNIIAECKKLAGNQKLISVVDAQSNFERFQGFTMLTPNQPDVESMVGFSITNQESLQAAGKKMLEITSANMLLLTRGAEGMVLFEPHRQPIELAAFNRSEVFDVTGAGDTVVAAATLALATGSGPVEAMAIGNLAASIVVKKSGAAVTTQEEMLAALDLLSIPE